MESLCHARQPLSSKSIIRNTNVRMMVTIKNTANTIIGTMLAEYDKMSFSSYSLEATYSFVHDAHGEEEKD